MPHFNVDSISIDPSDYVSECSDREIRELLGEIRDNHEDIFEEAMEEVVDQVAIDRVARKTDIDGSFQQCLRILSDSWVRLSIEDEEVIRKIGKKYGAV